MFTAAIPFKPSPCPISCCDYILTHFFLLVNTFFENILTFFRFIFRCPKNVLFLAFWRHCTVKGFVVSYLWVIKMNIAKFIQSHKELNELPFLIVFRTLSILKEMNMLKFEDNADVETKK